METTAALSPPKATPTDLCDDRELLARFRAGESAAFEAIVAAHQQRIVRLVHRLLGGIDEVDDVTQEVFLAVLQNLGRFRGKCKLSTWLTTIAVNKCRSRWRRQRLRHRLLAWLAKPDAGEPEPGRGAEAAECHQRVRGAVEQLPAKYREPIVLRYYQQMSVRRRFRNPLRPRKSGDCKRRSRHSMPRPGGGMDSYAKRSAGSVCTIRFTKY